MSRPTDSAARDRILDAAQALLEGPDADFTLEALCRAAQVSRSTLYRRFNTRDEILLALREERQLGVPIDLRDVEQRILDAGIALIGAQGLSSWTIEDIARHAEVSPTTVYRHFGDRMGLMQASSAQLFGGQSALFTASKSLEDTLLAFARQVLQILSGRPGLLSVLIGAPSEADASLQAYLAQRLGVRRRLAVWLGEEIERGRLHPADPGALAGSFLGLLIAEARLVPDLTGQPLDIDAAAERAVRLFLEGARA
ncbi:MAG: TetR family transcriptional regulator [Alphaproteobacteria bacterium]|nr:TetR family transcriptional regulator [Alphaproteobacteria bacterium]